MASGPPFPVPSKTFSVTILGHSTDLVLCAYDDFVYVMATQIGKLGTLLHAKKEEGYGGASAYNVNVIMGKREEPLLIACARQLVQTISDSGSSRALVIALGLKDHSQETLKQIIDQVIANKVW